MVKPVKTSLCVKLITFSYEWYAPPIATLPHETTERVDFQLLPKKHVTVPKIHDHRQATHPSTNITDFHHICSWIGLGQKNTL